MYTFEESIDGPRDSLSSGRGLFSRPTKPIAYLIMWGAQERRKKGSFRKVLASTSKILETVTTLLKHLALIPIDIAKCRKMTVKWNFFLRVECTGNPKERYSIRLVVSTLSTVLVFLI